MDYTWSGFGERLTGESGILNLMDDLGAALAEPGDIVMMGGGNPAGIPAVQSAFRRRVQVMIDDGGALDAALGNYDPPQGNARFLDTLAGVFRRECGWDVSREHIAVTNGGQSAFFFLLNMLAGAGSAGRTKRVLFPMIPEYIGYADQVIAPDGIRGIPARIDRLGERRFKYRLDFDRLELDESVAAVCVTRPTNPTSNVLTDAEVRKLARRTGALGIPLMIDNAYGLPFPGIVFSEAHSFRQEGILNTFSLSKLGMPGTRTGIVVADPPVIRALSRVTAVTGLANGAVGPAIAEPLFRSGEIMALCRDVLKPFYFERARRLRETFDACMNPGVPWRLHECEGAFFAWLWLEGLPISSRELYERLKARGVLVVPGESFFYGLSEPWPHARECIRVSYCLPDEALRRGVEAIAEEVERAY